MKSNYENTLDENFKKALNMCQKTYSYEELIHFLEEGNIPEKQYSALMLDNLNSKEDSYIFISNLINCDGKIREAVAQKFTEFIQNKKYCEYFSNYPETFAKATIDINANISRMVIEGLEKLIDYSDFGYRYAENLCKYINEAFNELDKIIYKDKKYTINKQLFKLYWCLEGLKNYHKYIDKEKLKHILERVIEEKEYTIKEKAAQIIVQLANIDDYKELVEKIKKENNYYVKQIIGE